MESTQSIQLFIIPALLLVGMFFYIIRAWRNRTFWSNNISSALGGAVIGGVVLLLFCWYLILTLEGAELAFVWVVFVFGFLPALILGAAIFVAIGATKRKNAPVTQESSLTLPPSIASESDMIKSSEKLTLKNRIKDEPIIAILTIVIGGVIFWLGGILAAIIAGAIFYYFFGTKKK